ncbi:LamG domain-containing protein [Treponema sp. OMZ 799]|uniref:LamG domain-containing protein n=1 Tax=Treponema sp. OMZ 799 TaxID=2563668 RepID=UPI0020A2B753|nr:LamG domain-containing protein [Treponema sp. OMZ 799]UTC78468.1 LamG domain-containing protein [Treponema sp. OMZ 799]
MKRLCVIILVLGVLISSCGIKTNLDIQEAVFPPEHSIIVYQDATSQGFKNGSTLSLVGIGDAGYSSWEELHIENLTEHEIKFDGLPKITNTDVFEIRDTLFKYKIGPYERTAFEVRYKLADIGSVETGLTIDYRVNDRKRKFSIRLNGNFIGLQIVEVIDANPPAIPTEIERNLPNGGAGVDFGYKPNAQAKRKFRIKNNSNERITIHSVSLDSFATIAGFNFDGQTGLTLGVISANSSKDFELIFPESSMPTYKEGNIVIQHDRSPLPYKIAVCGGGEIMPIEIVHRKNGQDVSCVVPYKLDKNCYDFGYKSAVSESQAISIKNMSKAILRFENIDVNLDPGPFTLEKNYGNTELVYPGEKAGLEIKFTPQPGVWSEKDITIDDKNTGRKYTISLTGSGFKQPKDIKDLVLWLRADRIGLEHISEGKINCLPDVSGNNRHAYKYKGNSPTYSASGVSGLPSATFANKEGLAVICAHDDWMLYEATASTAFLIFSCSNNINQQIAITGSNGSRRVYPSIGLIPFQYDPVDGVYGNGANTGKPTRIKRFYIESDYVLGIRSPSASMTYDVESGKAFSAGILVNVDISGNDPQVRFYVNGNETKTGQTPIAYLYSAPGGTSGGSETAVNRAYGYPVGENGSIRDYALGPNQDTDPCKLDYAWSLPGNSAYFSSRLATHIGVEGSGTLKNLYIGKNADESLPFYGQIAEVMIFKRALTDDEIKDINNYIVKRYNTVTIESLYTRPPYPPAP